MNTNKLLEIVGFSTAALVIFIGFPLALTQAQSGTENHSQMNMTGMTGMMNMGQSTGEKAKTETISLEKVHSEQIPMVSQHIDKAVNAIKAGRNSDALAELQNAKVMLATVDKAVSQHITPKFVNDKCPIMGTAIDPANVTEDLTREYKGQKVAFCCNMCPSQWDKLSDAEKEAKLAKVKISAQDQAEKKI